MEDLTGKQFGHYHIVAPLGEGGMAAVYKAYQPAMERYVAIKVLPRHLASSEEFTARFRREARMLAQLQHSHILPVFDYGEAEGYPYIVMPFVPSGTLADLLRNNRLSLPQVRYIMTQIGEALSYAHGRGMIHRDVKPSNVLIDESGNCLLTDFGLARMAEASTKLTGSGTVMGTPAYMSPEQGTGANIDHRSDIYSLGIILYEMVTGRVPYQAETPIAVVFKHIQAPLPSARTLNPNLPEAVELVLLKALAKSRDDRFQSAKDFVQALQKSLPDAPLEEKVPGQLYIRSDARMQEPKQVQFTPDLMDEMEDTRPYVREAAVQKLEKILKSGDVQSARSAVEALEKIIADENTTRRVAQAAAQALESYRQAEQKAEEERNAQAKLEAEEKRRAAEKAEAEKQAALKAEKERLDEAKREAERLAEAERAAKAKLGAEATVREVASSKGQLAEGMPSIATTKLQPEASGRVRNTIPPTKMTPPKVQTIVKWTAIGVVGFCFLLAAAYGGLSYLAKLGSAPVEPTSSANTAPEIPPTESPIIDTPTVAVVPTLEIQHGTLRVNTGDFPDTLDPQKSSFVNEIGHINRIYEGLTKLGAGLETIPAAAESWEYNTDATQLTFTLRDNLVYADGSVLNAERFAYSIRRNIDPETASAYGSITDEITGAPEWRSGNTSAKSMVEESVSARHADGSRCTGYADRACNTLVLSFSKPAPYFHTVMSLWVVYPAKQENIEAGGETWWLSPKYQLGNGAWILQELDQNSSTIFVSNPNYYGGEPYYDIEYRYLTDSAAAFEAFRNNELDIITPTSDDFQAMDADPDLKAQYLSYAGSCTIVIKFNLHPTWNGGENPFTDKKVREAFALGFDAASWAREVDDSLSTPTWTWIPPGYPGFDATSPLRFDPEAARAALQASRYGGPEGLNKLGLKLTFSDTARNRERYEWLAASYKTILGVEIALDPVETTTFNSLQSDPATYPLLIRTGWCADYPDPQNWLSVYWKSDTSFAERQGFNNTKFDALVNAANVEIDAERRIELYAQAQQVLLESIPAAFGYNTAQHFFVKPWVKGYVVSPQDLIYPGDANPTSIYIDASMLP